SSTFTLKLYPNPANNYVIVESDNSEILEISIFDTLGKNVMPNSVLKNSRLDVSSLNRGVYFMRINANSTQVTKKIIIE
ncbi:T9SS type A sorting domain-containing protein, partial [Flavobacteriaceae bacterium]|nr:T9SS type A sorting domain-containing protein [Flavobacteriaceae bacterium]